MQSEITTSGKSGVINDQYKIISEKRKKSGVQTRPWVKVECSRCGAIYEGWKQTIQRKAHCRGCLGTVKPKPVPIKTDEHVDSVSWLKDCELCNNGVCKQIDDYRDQGMSVNAATIQMEKDCDGLWEADKIRGRYRYYKQGHVGGKPQKEKPRKPLVEPTKEISAPSSVGSIGNSKTMTYRITADIESVQSFLNKYLPGYKIVSDNLNGGM